MAPSRRPPRGTWPAAPAASDLRWSTPLRWAAACSGAQKTPYARVPNGNPLGAGDRPRYGCRVGTRAPVASSPALPAGLVVLRFEVPEGSFAMLRRFPWILPP
jgi:hypothetical protein